MLVNILLMYFYIIESLKSTKNLVLNKVTQYGITVFTKP